MSIITITVIVICMAALGIHIYLCIMGKSVIMHAVNALLMCFCIALNLRNLIKAYKYYAKDKLPEGTEP